MTETDTGTNDDEDITKTDTGTRDYDSITKGYRRYN